jgi:hypothetical protein
MKYKKETIAREIVKREESDGRGESGLVIYESGDVGSTRLKRGW